MTRAQSVPLVILISGNGSNLQAIIDACTLENGVLYGVAKPALVISNREDAYGLVRAKMAQIPSICLKKGQFLDRNSYDLMLIAMIQEFMTLNFHSKFNNFDKQKFLLVCAGWMRILGAPFIERCLDIGASAILNLHPALPGAYPGIQAVERAYSDWLLKSGGKVDGETGVMVHHVVPEIDAGPVVATRTVPIKVGDDLEALKSRIHDVEHELIVEAINTVITNTINSN